MMAGTGMIAIRGELLGLLFLLAACQAHSQELATFGQKGNWDFSVWTAGETGEQNTNAFTEAQIWSAGVSLGRVIMHECSSGWRRGSLEYAFSVMPVFQMYGIKHIYGGGFEPVIFRWNSVLHWSRVSPYVAGAGGGVFTNTDFPPVNTSTFNAMAKAGGGLYIRTRNRQYFDVGLGWSHISNANLGVRNPQNNGIRLSIAYHWLK